MDTTSVTPDWLQAYLPFAIQLAQALLIFGVGWLASKWSSRLVSAVVQRRDLDRALGSFLGSLTQYTVLTAAVIAALGTVGIETTSLVAVFGSAGLAVGLALQGNLANFASGVMILFFKPFVLEDKIEAAGVSGAVKDIGLFATTLHTPDNKKIIVSNAAITGGTIVNLTALGARRFTVDVGVAYGEDVGRLLELLQQAGRRAAAVHASPDVAVAFVGLGASSIDFQVHCWCDAADLLGAQHDVRRAIYEDLNAAGVDIPYNQLVIHRAG